MTRRARLRGDGPLHETNPPQHRWLLIAASATVAATAGYVLHLQLWPDGWQRIFADVGVPLTLILTAWSLAPMAGATAVMVAAHRSWPRGQVTAAVGVGALAAFTFWSFADYKTSLSSTTGLIFVFLPPYQWLIVLLGAAAAAITHHLRRPRTPQRPEAPQTSAEG